MRWKYGYTGTNNSVSTTEDIMVRFLTQLLIRTRDEMRKQNSSTVSFVAMIKHTPQSLRCLHVSHFLYQLVCILSSTVYIVIFLCSKHWTSTLQIYEYIYICMYVYIYIYIGYALAWKIYVGHDQLKYISGQFKLISYGVAQSKFYIDINTTK
jgi:hypothetical protein